MGLATGQLIFCGARQARLVDCLIFQCERDITWEACCVTPCCFWNLVFRVGVTFQNTKGALVMICISRR
jgi:hypothetical protein